MGGYQRTVAALLVIAGVLAAAQTRGDSPNYRRVFVPAGQPESWPTGGERYLPVEQAELGRLLSPPQEATCRVESVTLEGRYEPGRGIRGAGVAELIAEQGPVFLSWPASGVRLTNVRWTAPRADRARLGRWPASPTGDGGYGIVVPGSGRLRFDFRAFADDDRSYHFGLPTPLRLQLTLALPEGVIPAGPDLVIDRLATSIGKADGGAAASRVFWRIRPLAGRDLRFELRDNERSPQQAPASFSYSTSSRVEIAAEGSTFTTRLRVRTDTMGPQAYRLVWPAAQPVTISSVEVDSVPAEVRSIETNAARILARHRPDDRGYRASIEVRGWAPVSYETPWRGPTIRLEGGVWEEGDVQIAVAPNARIADVLRNDGAVFTPHPVDAEHQPDASPLAREVYSLRLLRKDADVAFSIAPRVEERTIRVQQDVVLDRPGRRAGVSIALSTPASLTAETLVLDVNPGWSIESIQSTPSGLIDSWRLENAGSALADQLELKLRSPAAAGDVDARVVLLLHREEVGSSPTPIAQLAPIVGSNARISRNRLGISAAAPWIIKASDRRAAAGEGNRTGTSAGLHPRLEFDLHNPSDAERAAGIAVSLGERRRRIDEKVAITVAPTPRSDSLRYTAQIDVTGRLSEEGIQVVFTPRLPPSAVCRNAETRAILDVRRSTRAHGEVWWLPTPQPGQEKAGWQIEAELDAVAGCNIPLATVLRGASREAMVAVRGEPLLRRKLSRRGLVAEHSSAFGELVYRYRPQEVGGASVGPAMAFGPAAEERAASGVNTPVRLAALESRWIPGSGVAHAARFERRDGARKFVFGLPATVDAVLAEDAGGKPLRVTPVARLTASSQGSWFEVDNPAEHTTPAGLSQSAGRWSPFTVRYTERPDQSQQAAAVVPEGEFARSDWRWTLRIPAGWAALDARTLDTAWRRRLFGSFARPSDEHPFNPLNRADWIRLFKTEETSGESVLATIDAGSAPPVGWRSMTFRGAATAPAPVRVGETDRRAGLAMAVQCLVMTLAAWRFASRATVYAAVVAGVIVAALLVPESAALWVTAILHGLVLAWPFRWLTTSAYRGAARQWPTFAATTVAERRTLSPRVLGGLVILGATAGPVTADDIPRVVAQVLIPVDADGQLAGDKHYVPESFLRRLLEQDRRRRRPEPGEVVLYNADYEGELTRDPGSGQVRSGSWVMKLGLESTRANAVLRMPLSQVEADWRASATVDGAPAPLRWSDDGRSVSIALPEAGPAAMVLKFEPKIATDDNDSRITMALPRVPGGRLTLRVAEPIPGLEFLSADRAEQESPRVWRTTLDGSGRLDLRWPLARDPADRDAPTVDILQWLKVSDEEATVTLRVTATTGFDSVRIDVPLGWESVDNPEERSVDLSADAAGGRAAVTTRFTTPRRSPLGQFRLPPLSLSGAVTRRRLVAVSFAEGLRRGVGSTPDETVVAPTDFLGEWDPDGGLAPPDEAALLEPGAAWTVGVEPDRSAVAEAPARLAILVGDQQIRCRLEASLAGHAGPLVAIRTPVGFEVESVTQFSAAGAASLPRSRPSPDRLVVYSKGRSAEQDRLVVVGSLPRPAGPFPIPFLAPISAVAAPVEATVFREEAVLARLSGPPSATPTPPGASSPFDVSSAVWPVGVVSFDENESSRRLDVSKNPRSYSAKSLTTFRREGEGVSVGWLTDVRGISGSVGELPIVFAEPPSSEPRLIDPTVGSLRANLTDPAAYTLRLSNPIEPGATQRVALHVSFEEGAATGLPAPIAGLPDAESNQSFVALDDASASGPQIPNRILAGNPSTDGADWSVQGLRAAEPESVATLLPEGRAWRVFQAADEQGDGRQQERVYAVRRVEAPTPRLALAEHKLVKTGRVEPELTSRLALQPGGASRVAVALGTGMRLVSLAVDGGATAYRAVGNGTWEVELRSPTAPQVVEVVTAAVDGSTPLSPPRLMTSDDEVLVPERALWEVLQPEAAAGLRPPGFRPLEPATAAVVRLRVILGLATEAPAPNEAWRAEWRPRVRVAANAVRRLGELRERNVPLPAPQVPASASTGDPAADLVQRAEEWLAGTRFDHASRAAELGAETAAGVYAEGAPAEDRQYFIAESAAVHDAPDVGAASDRDLATRLAVAVVAGGVVLASRRQIAAPDLAASLYPIRHAIGAVAGVAWWLLLTPSALGLLLVACSAAGLVRQLRLPARSAS